MFSGFELHPYRYAIFLFVAIFEKCNIDRIIIIFSIDIDLFKYLNNCLFMWNTFFGKVPWLPDNVWLQQRGTERGRVGMERGEKRRPGLPLPFDKC